MGWHYAALEDRFRRISGIEGALSILHWDTAVVMPRAASASRGDQLATLKRVAHDMLTAEETGELIAAATEEAELDAWQAANLREMQREYRHARAMEPALVEALTRATTKSEMVWREARAKADFPMLRADLEEVVRLTREAATVTGAALGLPAYDALLDIYQPDLRDEVVAPLFDELAAVLPGIADALIARSRPAVLPKGPFPLAEQKALGKRLMTQLGFDFEAGRLDESTHPFCGGTPQDIRITTRYREDEVASALMGVLHETGHALYEAGLPRQWLGQPVGNARGIAVHESQSLLMEMQACRSPAFIGYLGGELRRTFGDDPAWATDNLVRLYHKVERSLIRVDADEVTYPLHVILRWRLERALIAGDLAVADLPTAWNDKYQEYLGVVPSTDADGVLQDIHWPAGLFGYFPTYSLGNLAAAQFYEQANCDLGGMPALVAQGQFAPLLKWLQDRVHRHGRCYTPAELVEYATHAPLSHQPLMRHLRDKLVPLYEL